MRIISANVPQQLHEEGVVKTSFRFQNHGPGVAVIKKGSEPLSMNDGFRIVAGGILEDVPPGPIWRGSRYIMADAANTEVAVEIA